MPYVTPPRTAPTPLMNAGGPTTLGALPFLDLVCGITLVENSCLRAVQAAEAEELDAQFMEGRSSPMFHGNAMALLFEAAMDDEVERPYLMDLAEALYQVSDATSEDALDEDEDLEDDEEEDDGHFAPPVVGGRRQTATPSRARGGPPEPTEEDLADDYGRYDDDRVDDGDDGERGTSPMQGGGYYSSAGEGGQYEEEGMQYDVNGEPLPQRSQTALSPHPRQMQASTPSGMTTNQEDPLMSYWRSHTASPNAPRQPTPATRPATRQDLNTRGTVRSNKDDSENNYDENDGLGGTKQRKKKQPLLLKRRALTPSSFSQHKKLPHPLKTPPRSRAGITRRQQQSSTNKLSPARGSSTARSNQYSEGDTIVSTRTGKMLPPLAEESLKARGSLETAKEENEFWCNRLKMLQRELDKAQIRADAARNKDTRFEVSAVVNETVSAQLKEERRRDFALRSEKAQAIRAHKAAHRQAVRQAHSQSIQNKAESGRLLKVHQRNHQAIMDSIKKKEFDEKCERRAEVQQVKVVSMLKRLREKAMKHEEIKRNYSLKVDHVRQEEKRFQEQSIHAVDETSKLVAKIRRLREVEGSTRTSDFVLKGLDSQLYTRHV